MKSKRSGVISLIVVALVVAMLVLPLLAFAGQQYNTYTGTLVVAEGTLTPGPNNVRVSVEGWSVPQYGTATGGVYGMTVQGDDNTDLGKALSFEVKIDGDWVPAAAVCVDCEGATPEFVDTGEAQTIDLTAPSGVPTVAFGAANYDVTEGGMVTVEVVLSGTSADTVTVNYNTVDVGDATPDVDYNDVADGTVTFNPGEAAKTFQVQTIGDTEYEPGGEVFNVQLANANNAVLGAPNPAQVTILDDDPPPPVPEVSFANMYDVEEGESVTIFVVLSGPSVDTITVNYTTTDIGDAAAGVDYTTACGMLTFVPGDVAEFFTVNTIEDTILEGDEVFNVSLSSPTNATLGALNVVGVPIFDDDVATQEWWFGADHAPLIAPFPNNVRPFLAVAELPIDNIYYAGDWFQIFKYDENDEVPGCDWLIYVRGLENTGACSLDTLVAGEYYLVVVSDALQPLQW